MVILVGEDAAQKLNNIFVFNDTVSRWIDDISQNIRKQAVDEIKKYLLFVIKLSYMS